MCFEIDIGSLDGRQVWKVIYTEFTTYAYNYFDENSSFF